MAQENVDEFAAAEHGEVVLRGYLEPEAARWRSASPDDVPMLLGDRAAKQPMTQKGKHVALEAVQGAIETGIWGWLDDDIAAVKDWPFDLTSIRVPVDIWHGEDDEFVPLAHGEWLAANIPGASLHLCRSKGHISLADEFDKVVDLFQKMD